jgi:TRAP-type mannitol/chloroaromatic compound transport system substrate-binding protein
MKFVRLLRCFLLALVIVPLPFSGAYAQSSKMEVSKKVFNWKIQTWAAPGTLSYKGAEVGVNALREASGGRLDFKLYGGGQLVGMFEMFDAVSKGLIEAAIMPTAAAAGKDQAFSVLCGLIGLEKDTTEARVWAYHWGGNELAEELFAKYNIQTVGPILAGIEPLHTKRPVKSLADLKGMKIRTIPGISSTFFEKLGAIPVNLPGGEIYSALNTGIIDGTEWLALAENIEYGVHEVAKYVLWPSFHTASYRADLIVNMKTWQSLPPDLQSLMKMAVYVFDARWDYWPRAEDVKALQHLKDKGIVHTRLTEEEFAKARQVSLEVIKEFRDKSPMTQKVVDSAIDYYKKRGIID